MTCVTAQLKAQRSTSAGVFVLHAGMWPSYSDLFLTSAAANAEVLTLYLVTLSHNGTADHPRIRKCPNCVGLPMSFSMLHDRVSRLLGERNSCFADANATGSWLKRKLCDFKPFVPSIFPEIAARHTWLGWSDYDLVLGNLSADIRALDPRRDDVLTNGRRKVHLSTGNFVLMRTSPHVLTAWKRSRIWRRVLQSRELFVFDEWWGPWRNDTMDAVFHRMVRAGELKTKALEHTGLQDEILGPVEARGGTGPWNQVPKARHESPAWHEYQIRYAGGKLMAAYTTGDTDCVCALALGLLCFKQLTLNSVNKDTIRLAEHGPAGVQLEVKRIPEIEVSFFHLVRFKRVPSYWKPQYHHGGKLLWTSCMSTSRWPREFNTSVHEQRFLHEQSGLAPALSGDKHVERSVTTLHGATHGKSKPITERSTMHQRPAEPGPRIIG